MRKLIIAILLLLGIGLTNSCTDRFEEMNTDPNSLTSVNPAYFFAKITQAVFTNYQRNWDLYADLYSQYWANTVGGFGSPRYEYNDGWVGNFWNEFYTEHLRRSIAIQEFVADKSNYNNVKAMNEILICYWWSLLSDYYGDVPYFKAGIGTSVPYSSQKDVYYDLLARLDNAVKLISSDANQISIGVYDRIYLGDAMKWQKFGNSLRLRLAMRLSNVDKEKAKTEAIAAINGAGGLLSSNADVAQVPIWKDGWTDYLQQTAWNWQNVVISKTFAGNLYAQVPGKEDPRAPRWLAYNVSVDGKAVVTSKEAKGAATYRGLENGHSSTTMPSDATSAYATINLSSGYVGFSGNGNDVLMYVPMMFYSEVLFLKSEAALRGWVAGDANGLYKDGVKASMDFVGVKTDDATAYIAALPSLSGSNEAQLKQLITQKWIANFPNGAEGWSDFRRTDYPDLTLPFAGVSGSASVASGTYVKRIRYPDNQHKTNEVNMPSGLNTTDKDRMDTKVWWDVAGSETKGANKLMNSNF